MMRWVGWGAFNESSWALFDVSPWPWITLIKVKLKEENHT